MPAARIRPVVDRPTPTHGIRKSLVGQEPGDPRVADLLARAVGFIESEARVDQVGDSRQEAVAVRASAGPLGPRSPGRGKGSRYIPDRTAVAGGPDPKVSPAAVSSTFRRRDDIELQSDLAALIKRRADLAAPRCAELFKAAIVRLQDRYGVTKLVPSAPTIAAWVDAVVPPEPGAAIAPVAGAAPYPPDPKAIALLSDPASEVIARGLLALAGRRPDLSDLQRYELFLAGRLHLVRKGDFIVQPTRQGISFTWIDLVAPVRIPPADAPARGQPDPQGDTPGVPDGPAGSPSLSDNPSAVDTLARTVRRGPGDLPGGLTWGKIEGAYRRLAAETTGFRYRRPRPDEPSRPEVAAALNVSPATLKRACEAAGVGSHWPPIRL